LYLAGAQLKGYGVKKALAYTFLTYLSYAFALPAGKAGYEMVLVQGGTFMMGCAAELKATCGVNLKPPQPVTLRSFKIGKYLVTVADFETFINATGYKTDAEKQGSTSLWNGKQWIVGQGVNWRNNAAGKAYTGDEKKKFPVVYVSYNDAQAYCRWLSLVTGKNCRLPTEAEWEYAARGGNKSHGYRYAGSDDIDKVAWYMGNSQQTTHAVGLKQPNELGLYDMTGNVWEWCSDWFGKDYVTTPADNPQGPATGSAKALRGGSWRNFEELAFPSVSVGNPPAYQGNFIGFRVVQDL
jgi:formylglycine-generating enzyme